VVGVPVSVVFLYLAVRGLQPGQVRDALSRAQPPQVAAAVLAMAAIYSLQAARWRWIGRHVGMLGWLTYLRFVLSSVAVNNVVPGRPGEVLRGYWLGRALRIPQARAFSTVVVDRSSDVLVLVVAFAATYPFIPHRSWLWHILVAAVVLAAVIALCLLLTRWHVRSEGGLSSFVSERVRASWLARQLSGLARGTGAVVNRRDAVVVAAITVVVWALWAVAAWCVGSSLGLSMSPLELIFITATINLGAAIPSSPGFVGTFQWLCVAGLALFGVGQTEAFAFSIIMHAVWYIPTTLIGLGLLLRRGASAWSASGDLAELSP
jgi:uncharacterized protein (TIRG00374 family)